MANFRPLQPAPMDQEQPPPPQTRPVLTQKPKRTVTLGACVACRKRKSKCDGNRPTCTCCTQKDTQCIYELGPNEKPSQAMKRKNEEMQGELSNLRQLYDFLRLRPEQEALEILRRIRENSPEAPSSAHIQELADFVRHGDLLIQPSFNQPEKHQHEPGEPITLPPLRLALDSPNSNPASLSNTLPFHSLLSMSSEGPATQRRRHTSDIDVSTTRDSQSPLPPLTSIEAILHTPSSAVIDDAADPRLAAATNWTAVTNDGNLLSLLFSAWHKWECSYYHFLDWDMFIDDMASGRTDFCSKLLVNALLASASFQSPLVKDRSKPFSDNVMTRFYKEARRLWELEEGQDSLPRLQAALCLFMVLGKHGRDKVGHTFLLEACRIGRDIGLFRVQPPAAHARPYHVPEDKWDKARAVAAWSLFNFQLSMSFTYNFPAIVKSQPPVPIPYNDTPDTKALFRSECDRNIIILDCANALLDAESLESGIPPKPEQIEVLYLRLTSWWNARPPSIDPIKNPSPENLLTAMQYHVSVNRLFQPYLNRDSTLERIKSYRDRARSVSSTSIKELRRLIVLHDIRHGWANAIPLVLHPIMVTSFGSLEEIALDDESRIHPERNEPYQGLLTCVRALSVLANYVFYAQPLFRLLTQTCQSMDIHLPPEVMITLDRYQSEEWTKNATNVVSSHYIADMRKTATDVENARMDAIISRWETLSIEEERRQSSRESSA